MPVENFAQIDNRQERPQEPAHPKPPEPQKTDTSSAATKPSAPADQTIPQLPKGFGICKSGEGISFREWHVKATDEKTHYEHASKTGVMGSLGKDAVTLGAGIALAVLFPPAAAAFFVASLVGIGIRHAVSEKSFRNEQFHEFDQDKLEEFVKTNAPQDYARFKTARSRNNVDMQIEILQNIETDLIQNGEHLNTLDFYPDTKYAGQARTITPKTRPHTPKDFAPGPTIPPQTSTQRAQGSVDLKRAIDNYETFYKSLSEPESLALEEGKDPIINNRAKEPLRVLQDSILATATQNTATFDQMVQRYTDSAIEKASKPEQVSAAIGFTTTLIKNLELEIQAYGRLPDYQNNDGIKQRLKGATERLQVAKKTKEKLEKKQLTRS